MKTGKVSYNVYRFLNVYLELLSGQYLRNKATFPASRRMASKTVLTRTIGSRNYRHSVTTIDWLSVHLSHGVNFKLKAGWTGGPAWRSHQGSGTGSVLTVRCVTIQPVLRVGTRRIGWSQSNHVTAINNGISMALRGKKKVNQVNYLLYFFGEVGRGGGGGGGEVEDYNNTSHFAVRQ